MAYSPASAVIVACCKRLPEHQFLPPAKRALVSEVRQSLFERSLEWLQRRGAFVTLFYIHKHTHIYIYTVEHTRIYI